MAEALARGRWSSRKFHGLARSLVANAVAGVTDGFKKELDIVGVGYRAELQGQAGPSSRWATRTRSIFDIPTRHRRRESTSRRTSRSPASIGSSSDRWRPTSAGMRKPDPATKQKGVRYTGEVLKKKVGKTGAK